jgi:hypothetical protein
MKFKDYLKSIKNEDTPEGDFAQDALRDRNFPWKEAEKEGGKVAIFNYLHYPANACPEAIQAFRVVWGRYLKEGNR